MIYYLNILVIYFYEYVCVPVSLCVLSVCTGAHGAQKRASDTTELDSQAVVSCHEVLGTGHSAV